MASQCKWKRCKKFPKPDTEGRVLLSCSNNTKCTNKIHQACLNDLLSIFGANEPVSVVVCGKRCFNAVKKALKVNDEPSPHVKRRVPWHSDGPTASISSVSCLIDWMTTGANYNRYRGGDSQHGETMAAIAGEIVRFIESCGVTTTRTAKDVQTKILSLEQSFKSAADWLGATGQGVEDETSLRNAVLARCPYYYDLFDVMKDRASTKPLMLNTDNLVSSDESSDDESVTADTLSDSESNTLRSSTASTGQPKLISAATKTTLATATRENGRKRTSSSKPRSIGTVSKKIKGTVDELAANYPLVDLKKKQLAQERDFQLQSLSLKREKVAQASREIDARVVEATARTLHFRAQAESCEMERKIKLLRERHNFSKTVLHNMISICFYLFHLRISSR